MPKKHDTIPLLSTVDPQSTDGFFKNGGAYTQNVMIEAYADGRRYATQRPGIDVVVPKAQFVGQPEAGRGLYYWAKETVLVCAINGNLFNGSGALLGAITDGKDPLWFGELGDYLIILDRENNQGWTLDGALTLTEITDPDFPATLAGGGAVLNGVAYVLDENGTIYNSAFHDPTSWAPLDFINAEREPDGGVYITKFLDQIVVFGVYTIEFFYDAANPVGSPLNRREDLSYRVGAYDGKSVYNAGDIVYFLASDISGAIKLMALNNFQLEYLSTPPIDRYMEERTRIGGLDIILSGAHTSGHLFVFATFAIEQGGVYSVQESLVYDATTKMFTSFETDFPGVDFFPVMGWTIRQIDSVEFAFGQFITGDVIRFSGSTEPIDKTLEEDYVDAGYIEAQQDYVFSETSDFSFTIPMVVRTEEWEGGNEGMFSQHNKFVHKIDLTGATIADFVDDGINPTLSWTDDNYLTYSNPREMSINRKRRLTACGMTLERAFQLDYNGNNKVRFENLSITFGVSSYA